ncbi:inositol 1,4,5-trisphosphate receptor-interacting protein-like 1 [Accipiter gentilis]|uniref:inositol 1,4,5-trisphosphate receptor-interacting protein-like 1 n=1 Tax=Astur gentilis TaxID=8957 RepID=UPI0021107A6B|nr:inositol 1,4,5-trisphosphate receptor-interacting protein-like 1 [Accipiter gentilis]
MAGGYKRHQPAALRQYSLGERCWREHLGQGTVPPPPGLSALAVIQFFKILLAVLSILWNVRLVGDELDEDTRERMRQREEYLSWKMTQMLQELEQGTQEQSGFAWGALLFGALQQWQFWVVAGVLLLLFGLCWWLRNRSSQPASSSKKASCRKKAAKKKQKVNSSVAVDAGRISVKRLLDLAESFMMVDEILLMCQTLSRNSFMPQVKLAVVLRSISKGWSLSKDDAAYNLLVPLKPPRGHAFHLELGNSGERPVRNSRVRVELECSCRREQLAGEMLCFLHHPEEELRKNQSASLLDTLCTGPYLDMEKTTRWFQILVEASWRLLPQSRHHRLTMLPSRRSCKLRLTNVSNSPLLIVMTFGVQYDGLDTFLSIE